MDQEAKHQDMRNNVLTVTSLVALPERTNSELERIFCFLPLSGVEYEGGAGEADGRRLPSGSHRRRAVRRWRGLPASRATLLLPELPPTSPLSIYSYGRNKAPSPLTNPKPVLKPSVLRCLFLFCTVSLRSALTSCLHLNCLFELKATWCL